MIGDHIWLWSRFSPSKAQMASGMQRRYGESHLVGPVDCSGSPYAQLYKYTWTVFIPEIIFLLWRLQKLNTSNHFVLVEDKTLVFSWQACSRTFLNSSWYGYVPDFAILLWCTKVLVSLAEHSVSKTFCSTLWNTGLPLNYTEGWFPQ